MSSRQLIDHNDDLRRLREAGYDIFVHPSNHIVMRGIPYVTAQKAVAYGMLVAVLVVAGDKTAQPKDHTVYWVGEYPCNNDGKTLEGLRHPNGPQNLAEDLHIDSMFSAKPTESADVDYFQLMDRYATTISQYAERIDSHATAKAGRVFDPDDPPGIFAYRDTASARARITGVSQKLGGHKIAIVGLGGTGSYVLDLLSKTPVKEIHLFDGDVFGQHNAFRGPGAATREEVSINPPLLKVDYWAKRFAVLHLGIVPHPYFLDDKNAAEIGPFDFTFICMDRPEAKKAIVDVLIKANKPFIDVGMGAVLEANSLGGILRTTLSTPEKRSHRNGVSYGDVEDEYTNIQIADLNALNAAFAVLRWKKMLGFYRAVNPEYSSLYTIEFNSIENADRLEAM